MKRLSVFILLGVVLAFGLAYHVAASNTVTYPMESERPGRIAFSFTQDLADTSLATGNITAELDRIVINSTGTETDWDVTVADEDGVVLFTKTDCSSAGVPYGYAFAQADTSGAYFGDILISGPLTITVDDVSFTSEEQTIAIATEGFTADEGHYTISYGGKTTGNLNFDATTAAIDTAIEGLTTIGTGNVVAVAETALGTDHDIVITASGTLAKVDLAAFTIDLAHLIDTGTAEVQTFSIAAAGVEPDDGHYHIIYGGQTSAEIAYGATTAAIDTAVEALSTIGAGNAQCIAAAPLAFGQDIVITGTGTLDNGDLTAFTVDSTALKDSGIAEVQTLSIEGAGETPDDGHYHITYAGQTTGEIAWDATTATIDTAVEALANIGAGNVQCVAAAPLADGADLVITFMGTLDNGDLAAITVDSTALKDSGIAEIQTLSIEGVGETPDAGHYHITYDGQTTGEIAWDATTETIDAAVEGLSTIGEGNAQVVAADPLADGQDVVITGTGTLDNGDLLAFTVDSTALLDTGSAEVQTLSIEGAGEVPDGGHYHIVYNAVPSVGIAWNATTAVIDAAVEGIAGIGVGNVEVVAANPISYGEDIVITGTGDLDNGDLLAFIFDSTDLIDTGNDEIQTVTQAVDAVSGHWHLTLDVTETGEIAWNAAKVGIDAALDAAFGAGVIVSTAEGGIAANEIVLTFSGAGVTKTDAMLITLDYTALHDIGEQDVAITASETVKGKADVEPTITVTETAKGVAHVNPTVTITETAKGTADVIPTVTITETVKGTADVIPTVTITETVKGVADVIPTATVTETVPGLYDLSEVEVIIYYKPLN